MTATPQHSHEVYAETRVDALYRLYTEALTGAQQREDLERLADRLGIRPYDPDAPPAYQDPFESDEEREEFLAFVSAHRRGEA